MMKKLCGSLFALMCGGGMLMAQGLFSKYERVLTLPEGYVCYRTSGNLNIDGKPDEADWKQAEPTATFVDISGEGFPKPCYDTSAKMLWDDEYLYVSAVLEEDNIKARLNQRDTIIYYDNDFEVFLDPDGDGQNYFEIETNAREVIFDLMLDRPYRSGGNFLIQWDCPGLKLAIHREGTLNNPSDKDKLWSVEMAIPHKALTVNFSNPGQAGQYWRMNYSRVQWLKPGQREENWVWMPTGKVDMHMPDRWGFLYLSDKTVGKGKEKFVYPYDMDAYKLVWALFYAQKEAYETGQAYLKSAAEFRLTDEELKALPEGGEISVEAAGNMFRVSVSVPQEKVCYVVDHLSKFTREPLK